MENALFSQLNDLLKSVNLDDVTSETNEGFSKVPDGSYPCEVAKAELKESKSGKPMVSMQLKIVGNGVATGKEDNFGNLTTEIITNMKNRHIFKNFMLTSEENIRSFASDMLKFVGEDEKPVLEKEYFLNSSTISEALECLVGFRIWVNVSTSVDKNDPSKSNQWTTLYSWKRVQALELEKLSSGK